MKVTRVSSKDLLIEMYGHESVYSYETIKTGSMRLGHELAEYLIRSVGGQVGGHRDPYDGRTRLGDWEFCLQRNTKNANGTAHDLERAPGRCVQILEEPNPGWMSAEDFLLLHGEPPEILLDAIATVRARHGMFGQLRLKV